MLSSRIFSLKPKIKTNFWSITLRTSQNNFISNNNFNYSGINFDDGQTAFKDKTTTEIWRGFLILKLFSYDLFVTNSLKMMKFSQKCLGEKLFNFFVRPTFYDQFVAGDDGKSMEFTIKRLKNLNILPMIACMMEEDVTESEFHQEEKYNNNLHRILTCLNLLGSMSKQACLQVKISGLMSPKLLIKINELSKDEINQRVLAREFSHVMTSGKFNSKEHLKGFNNDEIKSLEAALNRFAEIGRVSIKNGVRILVDAEFVSINEGINTIFLAMMTSYNQTNSQICCTIQCYLKSALTNIKKLMAVSNDFRVCFGVKIVRGAYMEQEKELAVKNNLEDPINITYEATGDVYNRVVDLTLHHISSVDSRCCVVIATHNETAVQSALKRIVDLNLVSRGNEVSFAQLYGMCDHVTHPLAQAGLNVYKSIPYGTISETLPYLYRRATENRSVMQGARKERQMLWSEIKQRIKPGIKKQPPNNQTTNHTFR